MCKKLEDGQIAQYKQNKNKLLPGYYTEKFRATSGSS